MHMLPALLVCILAVETDPNIVTDLITIIVNLGRRSTSCHKNVYAEVWQVSGMKRYLN